MLCLLGWAGWQLLQGGQELRGAADDLRAARNDVGGQSGVLPRIEQAAEQTAQARQRLRDPVVQALDGLPLLGRPVRAATAIATSADTAVREALLPLARAAGEQPSARVFHDGAVDLPYLAELTGPSAIAAEALREAAFTLSRAPRSSGIGRVDTARVELTEQLEELRALVEQVSLGARVAPQILGVDAPRTYLVVAQNPAEARGSGGLVGGYVVMEADAGILRTVATGSNQQLTAFMRGEPVADLGPEYGQHWGGFAPTVAWVNSNVSPHFPYAATIWQQLWKRQTGQQLDGFLTLDPVALSYLMKATGPVRLSDGTNATAENVVDLTLRDTYVRFDTEARTERKEYLQEISRGVAGALSEGDADSGQLLRGLARATEEARLKFWAADPAVQAELAESTVSGRLPTGRPAVGNVINDVSGSKLDYYLDRTFAYVPGCSGSGSSVVLTLRNNAPAAGLPDYVTPALYRGDLAPGTNRMIVTVYLPPQSTIREARLGDEAVSPREGGELGLRWVEQLVTLPPGESVALRLTFDEPLGAGADVARVRQALVREERFTVTDC
jgi:hypothetical protein